MQLSNFTDYSIRVLLYLSFLTDDERVTITQISEYYKISNNHLVKVVYNLSKLGYIETKQGKSGGIKLKIASKDINVGKLIRQVEQMELLNCQPSACKISQFCLLKNYLLDAKEAFLEQLEQYTIDDLMVNENLLKNRIR